LPLPTSKIVIGGADCDLLKVETGRPGKVRRRSRGQLAVTHCQTAEPGLTMFQPHKDRQMPVGSQPTTKVAQMEATT